MYAAVKRWSATLLLLMLCACATPPAPPVNLHLQLAPADLGAVIALQQHLKVQRNGRTDDLDAALEIDDKSLHLVGLAFGQRVLSLDYDGKNLSAWRHFMLPEQVRAEDVLQDIQLTLWPLAAINRALPAGWYMQEHELQRTLLFNDSVVCLITYSAMPRWSGVVQLENLRYHYVLTIESLANTP